jgi:hypothetical protein
LWGTTWDSWKSHLLLMRLAASTKFQTRLIGFSLWIMAPWTPQFRKHQLPCFWHETIPVRSADHEVVARYHGSRHHFVRLVLWARPMIFGGKREGWNFWSRWLSLSRLHISIHVLNILTNILFNIISLYMHTSIEHLDKYFLYVRPRYFWFFVWSRMTPKTDQFMNLSSRLLWRHIFVTSFWRRHYDVIFLWRHFDAVIMTSYFCDVILTPSLWRHIFLTSFWRRHYDVIFLWRHFITGVTVWISSPDLWRHFLTGFMNFLTGFMTSA